MPDDKSKRGTPDRSRVSANEAYEVEYLAREINLDIGTTKQLIRDYGPMRADIIAAKKRLYG